MAKVVFHVDGNMDEVVTDIPFDLLITMAHHKVPLSAFDILYAVKSILSIDLTENMIEIEAQII